MRRFLRWSGAGPETRVVDVGAAGIGGGAVDYFERWYPHPRNLTAVGLDGPPPLCAVRGIAWVRADGCELPFDDGAFDLAHSNAVIEHVGPRDRQRRFLAELCRVARNVWVATPDADSPFEPHTLLPFAHWCDGPLRSRLYRRARREHFADPDEFNPLTGGQLRNLFPAVLRRSVQWERQYLLGLPAVVVATLQR